VKKLLTVEQLSELIQVSPKTIYQWTHIRFIPFYKFPKGIRFSEDQILHWLEKRKIKGRSTFRIECNINQGI